DVLIVQEPYWYLYKEMHKFEGMHGSPYAYDAHVPVMLLGGGVPPGRYSRRISPADLAPTVCHLLGIQPPASSEGNVLIEALPQARAPLALEAYVIPALPQLVDDQGAMVLMPVTAEWPGGPQRAMPRLAPMFEGGFSGLAQAHSVTENGAWEPFELWTIT